MKKLLWYGDSPTASTGFGTVSRNVLAALYATGEWEITVHGVNYFGTVHDFPYQIHPAKTQDDDDQGKQGFLRAIATKGFDLCIVNNDFQVLEPITGELQRLLDQVKVRPKLIYYYPVDLNVPANCTGFLQLADQAVAYTRFGEAETRKVLPNLPVAVIPHGTEKVTPISQEERRAGRLQCFGIGDETFLWGNFNRNNVRKDMPRCLEAFKAFHLYQPQSKLYLHTQKADQGGNMEAAANELDMHDEVAFPGNFSVSNGGMPRHLMIGLYQLCDAFITTHLGEGWGLTVSEAMACGLPIVAPNNTTMPELLRADYPYLYPMTDLVRKDDSGFRPRGSVRDIFKAMKACSEGRIRSSVVLPTWEEVGAMWLQLIEAVLARPRVVPVQPVSETV